MNYILKNDYITYDDDLVIVNCNNNDNDNDNDLTNKNIALQNKLTMLYKENRKLRKRLEALQDLFNYEVIALSKKSNDKSL